MARGILGDTDPTLYAIDLNYFRCLLFPLRCEPINFVLKPNKSVHVYVPKRESELELADEYGHQSPGRGPQERAPKRVPGAHKRRPEAQDGRGCRAGARTAQGGTQLYSADWRTRVPGFDREGKAPKRGGATATHASEK